MKLTLTPNMVLAAQAKATTKPAATKPAPRKSKFLPGETRATVGLDGFRPLDVDSYVRKLYANSEPRNLTPPRTHCPKGIEPHPRNPQDIPCAQRTHLLTRHAQFLASCYIAKLLCNLHCASYRKWTVGGWTWREETAGTTGALIL